ncbi:transposase [Streptomyces flaveus]|uniref:Insertion element IS402-like domain-containing protein n=1 Tax=Streptomyces flaveus TaxID=66370 RepID=A0A917RNZ5_9ACTN|nr:transposase [Streptomyces flaveus]GGL16782.1 hypothetical protein GCM10010094_92000 [Streptomyces flaveus]
MSERKPYPSDLPDEQWALIEPVITAWKDRHRSVSGHQGAYDMREIVNAILYQGRTGCQWAYLPHDLPPKSATYYYFEPRIKAGVLLAAPGRGGKVLTGFMAEKTPFFRTTDFSAMTTPALVIAGDKDDSRHFTDMGPAWHTDPYTLAPGPKTLLTLFGAEHGLGGVAGYDAAETTDENPGLVAALAQLTAAYLHSRLQRGDTAWQRACEALATGPEPVGRVETK